MDKLVYKDMGNNGGQGVERRLVIEMHWNWELKGEKRDEEFRGRSEANE
jgi:hypothetical protein